MRRLGPGAAAPPPAGRRRPAPPAPAPGPAPGCVARGQRRLRTGLAELVDAGRGEDRRGQRHGTRRARWVVGRAAGHLRADQRRLEDQPDLLGPDREDDALVWYSMSCPDTVSYDWATATLKDNTTGTTVTSSPTPARPPRRGRV